MVSPNDMALGAYLLCALWLYYRWLERGDAKKRTHRRQQQEREGSVPFPKELQWRNKLPDADQRIATQKGAGDFFTRSNRAAGRVRAPKGTEKR